ncbi:DUF3185 family protein [Janthinobacterium sp. 17J80-10]|uniref:DUF3185 family protein n=1 Tax=Janthinobacterium sp. 17J80-10 TaxID=2497863 RepID=UPI0010056278|nr:DUF3185 family protein [Janthinobacterium sp. 17J80-10]QAU35502.1 DUF3185 family protein [Janthinobacterium sp. 17J80-10]
MNKSISLAILAGGIMLLLFGISEMNSFNSSIARIFNGAPSDRSIWMLIGGVMMTVAGAAGLALASRKA